ncbi:hypothetical protein CP791_01260 [Salmonella enterica]|nr:hypothetical protein [Salmonella enterica]
MVDYVNVPRTIATVISSGKASKVELDSVLGVQDLWDLLEIIQVDAHNERVMQETQNGNQSPTDNDKAKGAASVKTQPVTASVTQPSDADRRSVTNRGIT